MRAAPEQWYTFKPMWPATPAEAAALGRTRRGDGGRMTPATADRPRRRRPDGRSRPPTSRDRLSPRCLIAGVPLLRQLPDGLVYRAAHAAGVRALPGDAARGGALVRAQPRARLWLAGREGTGHAPGRGRGPRRRGRWMRLVRDAFGHWVRDLRGERAGATLRRTGAARSVSGSTTPEAARAALAPSDPGEPGPHLRRAPLRVGRARRAVRRTGGQHARRRAHGDASPTRRCTAYFERDAPQPRRRASCPVAGRRPRAARPAGARARAWRIVADRAIGGVGARGSSSSAPRPGCPAGRAVLAVESGARCLRHRRAARRLGRWAGARGRELAVRADGSRRERVQARSIDQEARLRAVRGRRAGAVVDAAVPDLGRHAVSIERAARHTAGTATAQAAGVPTSTSTRSPRMASRAWRRSSTAAEARRARRHRHHRPRAHRRGAWRPGASPQARGPARRGHRGRGDHHPRAATSSASSCGERIQPWGSMRDSVARVHEQGGMAIVAHPLVPYPLCASGAHHPRACSTRPTRATTPTPSRPSTRRRRGMRWSRRVPAFAAELGRRAGGRQSDAHRAAGRRAGRDALPGHGRRTTCAPPSRPRATDLGGRRPTRGRTSWACSGASWRKYARAVRDERARQAAAATAPVATSAIPAAAAGRRASTREPRPGWRTDGDGHEDRARHALHLPAAGRRQRARPAPLREPRRCAATTCASSAAPTARSAPARATSSAWATAGACPPTAPSARSPSRIATASWCRRCSTASASTCSTSTSRSCPSCRSRCCATPTSVNVATFHAYSGWSPSYEFGKRMLQRFARRLHGRIAVSAAARHFIERYFPGDYKVIPNGVDLRDFQRRAALRALARRHAQHPVRRPLREPQGPHVPAQGLPPAAPRGLRLPPAGRGRRAAGARGPPLHRHAAARAASSCWVASATPTRRAPSRPPTSSSRPRPARSRSASCCSRRWPPGVPIVCSDIHGYKGVVRRGEQALLVPPQVTPTALAGALGTLLRDPALRAAHGRSRAGGAPSSSAGRTSPPRSRTTTASSSAAWPPRARCPPASGPPCRTAPGPAHRACSSPKPLARGKLGADDAREHAGGGRTRQASPSDRPGCAATGPARAAGAGLTPAHRVRARTDAAPSRAHWRSATQATPAGPTDDRRGCASHDDKAPGR